jgi:hypothetical protein
MPNGANSRAAPSTTIATGPKSQTPGPWQAIPSLGNALYEDRDVAPLQGAWFPCYFESQRFSLGYDVQPRWGCFLSNPNTFAAQCPAEALPLKPQHSRCTMPRYRASSQTPKGCYIIAQAECLGNQTTRISCSLKGSHTRSSSTAQFNISDALALPPFDAHPPEVVAGQLGNKRRQRDQGN